MLFCREVFARVGYSISREKRLKQWFSIFFFTFLP